MECAELNGCCECVFDASISQNFQDAYSIHKSVVDQNNSLKKENKNLQFKIHTLTNELNKYTEALYRYYDQKNNAQEEIILLNCELDTKEEDLIYMQQELVNKNNEIQDLMSVIENRGKNTIREKDTSGKSNSDSESKLEPITVGNPSSSAKQSSSKCTDGKDFEQLCDNEIENLLCDMKKYIESSDTCDSYRSMFEKSTNTICDLISGKNSQKSMMKMYKDMASSLKEKNLTMENEITIIVNTLSTINNDKNALETKFDNVSRELLAKTEEEKKMSTELTPLKEELVNMKYALRMRIEEKSQIAKELDEKNQAIEENIRMKEQLEQNLIDIENNLRDTEMLKNEYSIKLGEQKAQYKTVTSELEEVKIDNRDKTVRINNLQKQILDQDTIIKSSGIQRKHYEEEILKLKEECSTVKLQSEDTVNKLNEINETLHAELTTTKLELANARECLRKNNEDKESLMKHTHSLEQDIENLNQQSKDLKSQNDQLTKTSLTNELELYRLKDGINNSKCQLTEITTEIDHQKNKIIQNLKDIEVQKNIIETLETTNCELKQKLEGLEQKNYDLEAEIDKLNDKLVQAKKVEISARKDLSECQQVLKLANSEIEGVTKNLNEKCYMTKCMEKKLKDAELKFNEVTCRFEQINEAHCKLLNKCTCGRKTSETTACDASDKIAAVCLECVGCQTDIMGKSMENDDSERTRMLRDYNRLVCDNAELQSTMDHLKEDIRDLRELNRALEKSVKVQKHHAICSKLSVHVGLQTSSCSLILPELDKPKYPDDLTSACSCTSNVCSCGSDKCAPAVSASSNYKHKEMEKIVQDKLCEMETELNERVSQCQHEIRNLNNKLDECKTTIRCKEDELNFCKLREYQLQQGLEELTVQIQVKDQKLESDTIKCASLFDTMEEYKKQLKSLKDALKAERSIKNDLEEQIQVYAEMCSIQTKQVTDLEERLETTLQSPGMNPTGGTTPQKNPEKPTSSVKRSKAGTDAKKPSTVIIPGLKLPYIPCCVGSANPCNRLKMWEASQTRMASSLRTRRGTADKAKKSSKKFNSVGLSRYEQLMYRDPNLANCSGMLPESQKRSSSLTPKEINGLRRELESKTNLQYGQL